MLTKKQKEEKAQAAREAKKMAAAAAAGGGPAPGRPAGGMGGGGGNGGGGSHGGGGRGRAAEEQPVGGGGAVPKVRTPYSATLSVAATTLTHHFPPTSPSDPIAVEAAEQGVPRVDAGCPGSHESYRIGRAVAASGHVGTGPVARSVPTLRPPVQRKGRRPSHPCVHQHPGEGGTSHAPTFVCNA